MKYFVYARKSTEDEERQIMSIEAQLTEINEFARREGLKILETFIESKSAKKPGRPVFNQMIEKIYDAKDQIGIIAWHPDRLARNSVDGGQIIYLIDIKKIGSLKFPTFWFEPTPQGLFMLQVSFGQSKYYSDNLSENVRRGIRQKIRRGEWSTFAPIGYVNNTKTRNIEPDPIKSRILIKGFEEYADGMHSLESLRDRLNFLGLMNKQGRPLARSSVHYILTSPVYIGLIPFNGELYEGKFRPIIEKKLWDRVQEELKRRSQPRRQKEGHNFPFTGLFRCGECGCMITAQYAKKGKYIYYRCTKKNGKCSQSYISSIEMLKQLRNKLEEATLPEYWAGILLDGIEREEKASVAAKQSFSQDLKLQILEYEAKIDKLIETYLDGLIDKDRYLKLKENYLKQKMGLMEKKRELGEKGVLWVEPARAWVALAQQAGKLALSDDYSEIKRLIKKIGSNRCVVDKQVHFDLVQPFHLLSRYRLGRGVSAGGVECEGGIKEKDNLLNEQAVLMSGPTWARTRDPLIMSLK